MIGTFGGDPHPNGREQVVDRFHRILHCSENQPPEGAAGH